MMISACYINYACCKRFKLTVHVEHHYQKTSKEVLFYQVIYLSDYGIVRLNINIISQLACNSFIYSPMLLFTHIRRMASVHFGLWL